MHPEHQQRTRVPTWVWAIACALIVAMALVAGSIGASRDAKAEGVDKRGAELNFLEPPSADLKAAWTGCWAGINLGYAKQTTEVAIVSFDASDVTYGVGAGCDVQFKATSIVIGIMGDHDWSKASSAIAEVDRAWFLGGRAGLLLSSSTLFYGLAGYTSLEGTIPAGFDTYQGLTLGAGLETMVTKSVSLKAEYRYVDLGSDPTVVPVFGPTTAEHSQHGVRLGINYRFGK